MAGIADPVRTPAFRTSSPFALRVPKLPLPVRALVAYLAAITVIGKGPTYLGVPPLFWGELTMILLVVWVVRNPTALKHGISRLTPLTIAVSLFMLLGAALTVHGFVQWKLEALRDAALWYYGTFFFVGIYITQYEWLADRVWKALGYIWVVAVFWGSADLATKGALSNLGPVIPWRGVTVLSNTGSELGQNVALGSVILLAGHTLPALRKYSVARMLLALAGLTIFAASYGRGQKVGFGVAIIAALVLTLGRNCPPMFPRRLVCLMVVAAVLGIGLAGLAHVDIAKATQMDRFMEADPSAQQGTHYWRMIWWQRLEHAVLTDSPWFGLGFGLNLCIYNPYLEGTQNMEWVARSPHNVNMTIFSRMGLVGVSLWGLVLLSGLWMLIFRIWNGSTGRRWYTPARHEELMFWLVMLITTWINSSFGVLMEGPALGIWFWFALGFASGRSLQPGTTAFVAERRARIFRRLRQLLRQCSNDMGTVPVR